MKQFLRLRSAAPHFVICRRYNSDYPRIPGKRSWGNLVVPVGAVIAAGSASLWGTLRKDKRCIGRGEENVISDWENAWQFYCCLVFCQR